MTMRSASVDFPDLFWVPVEPAFPRVDVVPPFIRARIVTEILDGGLRFRARTLGPAVDAGGMERHPLGRAVGYENRHEVATGLAAPRTHPVVNNEGGAGVDRGGDNEVAAGQSCRRGA